MAGIEEAFEKFVTRVSGRERSPAEQPLSKYKSYSEQELLENIEAKYPNQLQSFSQEDYQLNTMPMFEPKDVAPPRSYSPMPVERYLKGREYMDLAEGGLSNLIKKNIAPEYRLYTRTMVPGLKTGKLDENYFSDDFKLDLRKQALDKYSKTGELSGIVDEMDQHASRTKKNKLIRFPSTYAALGTYSYEIDPKTLDVKVKDKYDWNPAYGTQGNYTGFVGNEPQKGGRDVDASILKDYAVNTMKRGIDLPAGLELLGNLLGPRASKGEGVDIDINIPTEFAAMRADTPYADGGVASMFRERPEYAEGGFTDYLSNPLYQSFLQSPFYQTGVGTTAMTPVTLPSGEILMLPGSLSANQFKEYLASTPAGGAPVGIPALQQRPDDLGLPGFDDDPVRDETSITMSEALQLAMDRGQKFYDPIAGFQVNPLTGGRMGTGMDPNFITRRAMQAEQDAASRTSPVNVISRGVPSNFLSPNQSMQQELLMRQGAVQTGGTPRSVSEGSSGINPLFAINRAIQAEQDAAARVTPKMADGGRVSMSDGGLTTTVPPDKGPDSQGVESLFRRRYS
jgi:hypothetical protein